MARAYPSMTALLGLLAVAGFQNRDKIAEMLGGRSQDRTVPRDPASTPDQARSPDSDRSGPFGPILDGISEIVDRFKRNGEGDTVDSWVSQGPNKTISPDRLERAIGPDVLSHLSRETGLSREDLLARLCRELPQTVDACTPEGRPPGMGPRAAV